jgi:hypothetical protein
MTDDEFDEAYRRVHEAIGALLDEGEIAICWTLTIDVAGPDNVRYLAHRAGGGHDGTDGPMAWTALGMLRASVGLAERQLLEQSGYSDTDEDGDAEDGDGSDG